MGNIITCQKEENEGDFDRNKLNANRYSIFEKIEDNKLKDCY